MQSLTHSYSLLQKTEYENIQNTEMVMELRWEQWPERPEGRNLILRPTVSSRLHIQNDGRRGDNEREEEKKKEEGDDATRMN